MATPDKYNQPPNFNDYIPFLMKEFLSELIPYQHLICFIYAGLHPEHSIFSRTIDSIIEQVDEAYIEGKRNVFFDNIGEGIETQSTLKIHEAATYIKQKYPDVVCVLITGSANGKEAYHRLCNRTQTTPILEIIACHYFEYTMLDRWVNFLYKSSYSLENRSKIYTCLNRVLRFHRIEFLNKMLAANLVNDNCYYSFYNGAAIEGGLSDILEYSHNNPNSLNHILANMELVKTLKINTDPNRPNPADLLISDFTLYQDSYFSIIPETGYYDPSQLEYAYEPLENCVFLSEKTYKPILLRQPFILLSRAGSLNELHKRGFRTFHPHIDETYDNIEDDQLRMDAIVDEVKRLSNKTNSEWLDWVKNVEPIVEHNFNEIQSKTNYVVNKDLIGLLNTI